jgi:hypothetical protein
VLAPLALGVSIRWAHAGPADFTPVLAILAAIIVARFVIRARLTLMTTFAAAAAGAAWAAALPQWGFTLPTLAAVLTVSALRLVVDRTRPT